MSWGWILWFSNPFEPDSPPSDVSTLIKLRIAETYSNLGCVMLVPFGMGSPNEGWPPHRLVDGSEREEVSRYYRFISNMKRLFKNTASYSNIALVVSLPTAIWRYFPALGIQKSDEYYDEIRGWARVLEQMHVPYDVLFLGMNGILETDSYQRIEKYKLLTAPGLSRISSRDLKRIEEFLQNGGKLITTSDFARYDEMSNKQTKLNDWLNMENIIVVSKVGKSYWDSLSKKEPNKELFRYMADQINSALGKDKLLNTNASENIMITPIKKLDSNELILNLVNYNYHYNKIHDWTDPENNVKI